jgi:serine/threonine-protein phosphatase 2B regulatory subunit
MGIIFGKRFRVNEAVPGQGSNVIVSAGKLKLLRSDVDRMYAGFCRLDADSSGLISVHEFVVMNQVQSASFGEMAFRVLDTNSSGKIDFLEYMIAIWNFCSLSKESLSLFSFQIFDTDKSGILTSAEFRHMIDIIWGFNTSDHLEQAMKLLDKNKDGEVTLKEFLETIRRTPVLLFPTFELQEKIRKSVLNPKAWTRISRDRTASFGEGSIFEIIEKSLETDDEFHVNKAIQIVSR